MREAFGEPILDKQGISFAVADMATALDVARLLTWRASWIAARYLDYHHAEGSMSKLKASEVAVRITERAIQVCGGYGYVRNLPVEKWYRDAKLHTIFEGTSEIQRVVIGRTLVDEAPPLRFRLPPDWPALGRTLGRGSKQRSLAPGKAMWMTSTTPPSRMKLRMKVLTPPQKKKS
jgi:acyl-CoA dehydrogenase